MAKKNYNLNMNNIADKIKLGFTNFASIPRYSTKNIIV